MKLVHAGCALIAVASLGMLTACATPKASPNAGASVPVTAVAENPTPKPTVGEEVAAVAKNQIVVEFPPGHSELTPAAIEQLDIAARLFRDANPVAMFTTGYSDPSGDEFSNLVLSARRAEAVKRGLVARGIPADRLLIQALGASELANNSSPSAPENRRVVITWRLL